MRISIDNSTLKVQLAGVEITIKELSTTKEAEPRQLKPMTKLEFKAEVAKQLMIRGWDYSNLAEATGYKQGSLWVMFSDFDSLGVKAIRKISEALDIECDPESVI